MYILVIEDSYDENLFLNEKIYIFKCSSRSSKEWIPKQPVEFFTHKFQQYPLKRCANAIGVPQNGTPLVPRLQGMLHEGDRKKPSVKYFKIHAVRGLKKKIGRELFSMCSIWYDGK